MFFMLKPVWLVFTLSFFVLCSCDARSDTISHDRMSQAIIEGNKEAFIEEFEIARNTSNISPAVTLHAASLMYFCFGDAGRAAAYLENTSFEDVAREDSGFWLSDMMFLKVHLDCQEKANVVCRESIEVYFEQKNAIEERDGFTPSYSEVDVVRNLRDAADDKNLRLILNESLEERMRDCDFESQPDLLISEQQLWDEEWSDLVPVEFDNNNKKDKEE